MIDVLIDVILDSLRLFPFLFVSYILIEIIEHIFIKKIEKEKWLKSKWSVPVGAGFGIVPQCGFSIVATDLFAKKKLSMGCLIAIYLATSDECIPLLLTSPSHYKYIGLLIGVKVVMAIAVGYLVVIIYNKMIQKKNALQSNANTEQLKEHYYNCDEHEHDEHDEHEHQHEHKHGECELKNVGCCKHDIECDDSVNQRWKHILFHPLIHSLKIFAYVLLINFVFSTLVYYIGEANIIAFLQNGIHLQPLFATIVGLIPNCASSVILTELFLSGGLTFGALIAGLSVNAGLAYILLFKNNKNIKQNIAIISICFFVSVIVGTILTFII